MMSYIVAMDCNGLIGRNNDLPWRLPADLKHFKDITMGHPILMGRKTFDSIGRPLPGRENIILTRNKGYHQEHTTILHDIAEFLTIVEKNPQEEYFVIGGAEIFKELFPVVDRLYLTMIHESFDGDTYFPSFDKKEWQLVSQKQGTQDEKNPYEYEFLTYDRILSR